MKTTCSTHDSVNDVTRLETNLVSAIEKLSTMQTTILSNQNSLHEDIVRLNANLQKSHDQINFISEKIQVQQSCTLEIQSKVDQLIKKYQESAMTTSNSVKPTLETNSVHTTDLPTVLLIGTSNIKFIKEDKLTPFAKVIKQIGYTLDETSVHFKF